MSRVETVSMTEFDYTVDDYMTQCGFSHGEAITATRLLFATEASSGDGISTMIRN